MAFRGWGGAKLAKVLNLPALLQFTVFVVGFQFHFIFVK